MACATAHLESGRICDYFSTAPDDYSKTRAGISRSRRTQIDATRRSADLEKFPNGIHPLWLCAAMMAKSFNLVLSDGDLCGASQVREADCFFWFESCARKLRGVFV